MHTNLEAERQQSKNFIKGPIIKSNNQFILRKFSLEVRMGSYSLFCRHIFDLLTHIHTHAHNAPFIPLGMP